MTVSLDVEIDPPIKPQRAPWRRRDWSILGVLIDRFGQKFPEFLVQDGHRLTVTLVDLVAWVPPRTRKARLA